MSSFAFALPEVVLTGPDLGTGEPMWRLKVEAKKIDAGQLRLNYPVRVLEIGDVGVATLDDGGKFKDGVTTSARIRRPRVLSVDVISDNSSELSLTLALSDKPISEKVQTGSSGAAVHVRALAEPTFARNDAGQLVWPVSDSHEPSLPALKLAAGARVRIGLGSQKAIAKALTALGFGDVTRIDLTSDGLCFAGKIRLAGDQERHGAFLLSGATFRTESSAAVTPLYAVSLLPDELGANRDGWVTWWRSLMSRIAGASSGNDAPRLRAGLGENALPAIAWPVTVAGNTLTIDKDVFHVPARAVRVLATGTIRDRVADGVAVLLGETVKISVAAAGVRVESWRRRPTSANANPTAFVYRASRNQDGLRETFTYEFSSAAAAPRVVLDHEPALFAQSLRDAYGVPAPGTDNPAPLSAFTPVSGGWLQLPVPNLPSPKPSDVAPIGDTVPNALEGFVRLAGTTSNQFTSAHVEATAPAAAPELPWSIVVERAPAFDARLDFKGTQALQFDGGELKLHAPRLSCRGLFWYSLDRPGAMEAVPRLGAGPGSFADLPMETTVMSRRHGLKFTLDALAVTVTKERDVLAAQQLRIDPAPGLTVGAHAWLRHGRMPFVASMPMTRSARSAVRPLESRDLAPFAITGPSAALAVVARQHGDTFARLHQTCSLERHANWPWPDAHPDREGVSFAAVGVPGVEVFPEKKTPVSATVTPWGTFTFAYRYDIPILDEAFATAELPPVSSAPPTGQAPTSDPPKPPDSPASMLDPAALSRFWQRQRDRQQLTRIDQTYAHVFKSTLPSSQDIGGLIEPLVWPASSGFAAAGVGDPLPYGAVSIGPVWTGKSGNEALLGLEAAFIIGPDGKLQLATLPDDPAAIPVKGWSAGTTRRNGLTFDSRGVGSARSRIVNDLQVREVALRLSGQHTISRQLITAASSVGLAWPDGHELFAFWYKDLTVNAQGQFTASGTALTGTEFDVWSREKVAFSGHEWRLWSEHSSLNQDWRGFDLGGLFTFEPLRLESCAWSNAPDSRVPATMSLIGRVKLRHGDAEHDDTGNVVRLTFQGDGQGMILRGIERLGIQRDPQNGMVFVRASNDPLVFRVTASDSRTVTLSLGALSYAGGLLTFGACALEFHFMGDHHRVPLSAKTIDRHATEIRWSVQDAASVNSAGSAFCNVTALTFTVSAVAASFETTVEFGIWPARAHFEHLRISTSGGVRWLGLSGSVDAQAIRLDEANRSVAAHLDGVTNVSGTPIAGVVPATGAISGMVAMRTSQKVASGPLPRYRASTDDAALAEVVFAATGVSANTFSRVDWRVSSGEPMPFADWRRSSDELERFALVLRVSGEFERESAIAWPVVTLPTVAMPPPEVVPIRVPANPAATLSHRIRILLSDHELRAAVLAQPDNATRAVRLAEPWCVLARVDHQLSDGANSRVSWSSIDNLVIDDLQSAVRRAAAMPETTADAEQMDYVAVRRVVNNTPDRRMVQSGLRATPFAFRGVEGHRFLAALAVAYPDAGAVPDTLLLSGMFSGFVTRASGQRWLRVPYVITPFDDSSERRHLGPAAIRQRGTVDQNFKVAWPDTHAAPEPDAFIGHATVVTRFVESDLKIAVRDRGQVAVHMRVDQFFVDPSPPVPAQLSSEAFFVPALLRLSRLGISEAIDGAVSLVSAAAPVEETGVTRLVKVAPGSPPSPPASASLPLLPVMFIGGESLVELPWPLAADAIAPGQLEQQVRTFARRIGSQWLRHAAFAVLRLPGSTPLFVVASALPPPGARDLVQSSRSFAPDADKLYADGHLGWPLRPGDTEQPWRTAPELGATEPRRGPRSGLAGVAQSVSLPGWAAKVVTGQPNPPAPTDALVWYSEKRVPPYLSPVDLPREGPAFRAPAIQWLTPFSSRARIPTGAAVEAAHRTLHGEQVEVLPGQAFVPPLLQTLSVGDRAGVLSARIASLLGPAGAVDVDGDGNHDGDLDPAHPRYGRAGESSAAIVRHIRTPRPGPLPANRGHVESDRRVRPSPMDFMRNSRLIRGPVDVIRSDVDRAGTAEPEADSLPAAWEMVVGLASDQPGVVFDRWDGSIGIVFEVRTCVAISFEGARTLLWRRLLMPEPGTAPPKPVDLSAALMVGQQVLAFKSVTFDAVPQPLPPEGMLHRIHAVLDRRVPASTGSRGPADKEIADALREDGPVPRAMLAMTVLPKHPVQESTGTLPATAVELAPFAGSAPGLTSGPLRPPVTLRLPLSAILESRGALPLVPATVLFTDPSYDHMLGSPAHGDPQPLPDSTVGRGRILFSLKTDRPAYDAGSAVAFMVDVAYERRPDGALPDGDLQSPPPDCLELRLRLHSRDGGRPVDVFSIRRSPSEAAPPPAFLSLARTYELPIASLTDADAKALSTKAGDRLELMVVPRVAQVSLGANPSEPAFLNRNLSVMVTLTDSPVVEPPPALYSVLWLEKADGTARLQVPLHAQSPLPERTAFGDLKRDFRRNYIRRSAVFPWMLARPVEELATGAAFVVKVDRNGQLLLADAPDEFAVLEHFKKA